MEAKIYLGIFTRELVLLGFWARGPGNLISWLGSKRGYVISWMGGNNFRKFKFQYFGSRLFNNLNTFISKGFIFKSYFTSPLCCFNQVINIEIFFSM